MATTEVVAPRRSPAWGRIGAADAPRRALATWLPGTLLTLVAGLIELTRPELWRDEIASWAAADTSFGHLFHLLRHTDAVTGAYYIGLHLWIRLFGTSPLALRLPSVLAMVAAAACTALLGARVGGRRAGLVAGLLFAVTPDVSRFAQEARVYAFVILFFALSTLLLVRALEATSRGRWAAYGVALLALGLANLVAVVGVVGHLLLVAFAAGRTPAAGEAGEPGDPGETGEPRRRALRDFAVTVAVVLVCLAPLAIFALGQTETQIAWILPPDWTATQTFAPRLFGSVAIAIGYGLLACLAVVADRRRVWPWIAATLLPVLVVAVVSLVGSSSYWYPRYLLFLLPLVAVVAAVPLARLPLAAGVAAALAFGLLGIGPQATLRGRLGHETANLPYVNRVGSGVTYSGAAAVVAAHARPGDGWVTPSYQVWQLSNGLRYYLPRHLPHGRHLTEALVAKSAEQLGQFYPEPLANPTPAKVPERRLWLVGFQNKPDLLGKLGAHDAAFIRRYFAQRRVFQPARYTWVELYVRRGAAGTGGVASSPTSNPASRTTPAATPNS